jgi:hypothetical protein
LAADAGEVLDALAGVALADALLLLLPLLDALLFLDALVLDEEDFFEDDLAAVFFEVAAAASDGSTTAPASVDTSATTRSAVRTRMGRVRVNRRLWRAVNASTKAIPLTNFVNPTCAVACAQPLTCRSS